MKLPLSLVKQFIDLPLSDEHALRSLFDELGLEVEEVLYENGETFFKIETLAHRGDHLYALGIARELSARFLKPLRTIDLPASWKAEPLSLPVSVMTEKCEGYSALSLDLPDIQTLPKQVEQCMPGIDRTKHPLVHILNYAFLELGQPLHAFDRDLLKGGITVSESVNEETILALDGREYKVPSGSLLIRDEEKIVAVAGVIGCMNSMITPATKRVLIESATFDPVSIRKTAKKMGISTDASYAFERGCDGEARIPALQRVVYLLSSASSTAIEAFHLAWNCFSREEKQKEIAVSFDRIRRQANMPTLTDEKIQQRLSYLGYTVKPFSQGAYTILPPSWRRWNVTTEAAIIEDCLRVIGFNTIPLQLPRVDLAPLPVTPHERLLEHLEKTLLGNGFFEVVTKSYYSSESLSFLRELDPAIEKKHVSIKNAIDKENGYLKVTNCIHLARLADYNLRKGVLAVKVYECARLFGLDNKPSQSPYAFERDAFSFAVSGRWYEADWKKSETVEEKVFLFKGIVEALFQRIGAACSFSPSILPFLHPGCQTALSCNGQEVGFFGLLHPHLKEKMDLLDDVVYGELDVFAMTALSSAAMESISDYPSIKRDVTFKLEENCFAGDICEKISSMKPNYLNSITIRDSFKKGDENFRRVTYRLHFQSPSRTLSHEEVDEVMTNLLAQSKEQFGLSMA